MRVKHKKQYVIFKIYLSNNVNFSIFTLITRPGVTPRRGEEAVTRNFHHQGNE